MPLVNVHQAKTSLSRLLTRAESGEEIVIARNGKPSVRLVPVHARRRARVRFGDMKGEIWYSDGLHLPMPETDADDILNDPHLQPDSRASVRKGRK
ncbi:MAG TPA: type II toxin-antitoxin system prevent-host-death family antitoxin [Tepidisphaeraceae bacterium]|nr:type II toxin-antitoxin system prevent-host-death family antitoxin [Tepidisphaeraceae bacterium]